MAKFDEKLERMNYLMEFKAPSSNKKMTNIEFSTEGADGKMYGILREGTKYYIKTTEKGKETISESYDYIGGFNNKKSCEYGSYNDATKQLELKLMGINESLGVKKNVSTVNFNKSKEDFSYLTEEARKELDRMNMIFENSCGIGTGKVGSSAPFEKEAKATLDKDNVPTQSNPENATGEGYSKVNKDADGQLKNADKMPKGKNATAKGKAAPKPESEGIAVAGVKKEGAKKIYESIFEDDEEDDLDDILIDIEDNGELAGDSDEEEEYDGDIEELFEGESAITGPNDVLDGLNTSSKKKHSFALGEKHVGNDNGVVKENCKECGVNEDGKCCNGDEKAMRGPKGHGKAISWERMNESQKINALVNDVCRKLVNEGMKMPEKKKVVKESIQDKIQRMVNEEVTKLTEFGKHPSYRKKPMTLPPNTEVMRGSADRDWNDDSAKGEQPFGQKIGSSAPFTMSPNAITNSVLQEVKRNLKRAMK